MYNFRYLNPLSDFGFKRNFGDAEIMKAFLTDLLGLSSEIKSIKHLDKERQSKTLKGRGVVFDLLCETADGSRFIVEMQKRYQRYFSDRIVYYLSREIASQQKSGEVDWNYELMPVYGVFFLNFHLSNLEQRNLRTIKFTVQETGEVLTNKVTAYTLELPLYDGKPDRECKTQIDYWLYNLANMETMQTDLKFKDKQPAFEKMQHLSELSAMTKDESDQYFMEQDYYRTIKNADDYEYDQAREQGRAEGRTETATLIAKNLKQSGADSSLIARVTGLTEEEVSKL